MGHDEEKGYRLIHHTQENLNKNDKHKKFLNKIMSKNPKLAKKYDKYYQDKNYDNKNTWIKKDEYIGSINY